MNETILYIPRSAPHLFIHVHRTEVPAKGVFLFLNPLIDEKNRSQSFQAQTARALCNIGYHVVRFDYSGTGDSKGEIYTLSGDSLDKDYSTMLSYIREEFPGCEINLLGVRFGADLAVKFSETTSEIKNMHLVEPLFSGSKYITEQRVRRKMFHRLNNMNPDLNEFTIDKMVCEDFQGYLLNAEFISYIERINSQNVNLSGKYICLYKLDYLFSKKNYSSFTTKMSASNRVDTLESKTDSFWDKLEMVWTLELTQQIVDNIKKISHA